MYRYILSFAFFTKIPGIMLTVVVLINSVPGIYLCLPVLYVVDLYYHPFFFFFLLSLIHLIIIRN